MLPLARVNLRSPVNRAHPLNRGKVAWWLALPGWVGAPLFYDLMGLRPGTLTNMGAGSGWQSTTRPGGFSHLRMDGIDDHVTIANITSSQDFTWTMWMQHHGATSYKGLLTRSDGSSGLYLFNNLLTFYDLGATAVGVAISANEWHHITIVRDSTILRTYVDAVPWGNDALSTVFITQCIGGDMNENLDGYMDDVSIYNRALTSAEVMALYQTSRLGYPGLLNRIDDPMFAAPAPVLGAASGMPLGRFDLIFDNWGRS